MNIYVVKFEHASDHSNARGIHSHVAASSDEQVFEWLDKKLRGSLSSYIENADTTKEAIIANKGYLGAEDPFDSYTYGSDTYGWTMLAKDVPAANIDFMLRNSIIEVADEV